MMMDKKPEESRGLGLVRGVRWGPSLLEGKALEGRVPAARVQEGTPAGFIQMFLFCDLCPLFLLLLSLALCGAGTQPASSQ